MLDDILPADQQRWGCKNRGSFVFGLGVGGSEATKKSFTSFTSLTERGVMDILQFRFLVVLISFAGLQGLGGAC